MLVTVSSPHLTDRERALAEPLCAEHGVPLPLVAALLAVERSPVGRRGARGVGAKTRVLIDRALVGDLDELGSARPSTSGADPEAALTEVGEGLEDVRLVSLELHNFGIFRDARIAFPWVPGKPLNLLEGRNGYGKSTLIKALRFALLRDLTPSQLAPLVHQDAASDTVDISARAEVRIGNAQVEIRQVASFVRTASGFQGRGSVDTLVRSEQAALRDAEAREWLAHTFPPRVLSYFLFDSEQSRITELARRVGDEGHSVRAQLEEALGIQVLRRLADRLRKDAPRPELHAEDGPSVPELRAGIKALEAAAQRHAERTRELEAQLSTARAQAAELDREWDRLARTTDPGAPAQRAALHTEIANLDTALEDRRTRRHRWLSEDLPLLVAAGQLPAPNAAHPPGWSDGARHTADRVAQAALDGVLPWVRVPAGWGLGQLRMSLQLVLQLPPRDDGALAALHAAVEAARGRGGRQLASTAIAALERAREEAIERLEALPADAEDVVTRVFALAEERRATAERVGDLEVRLARAQADRADAHADADAQRNELGAAAAVADKRAGELRRAELAERVIAVLEHMAKQLRAERVDTLEHASTVLFRRLTNKPAYYDRIAFDRDTLTYTLEDHRGRPVPTDRSTGERAVLAMALVHGLQQASGRAFPLVIEAPLKPLDAHHQTRVLQDFLAGANSQTVLLLKPGELPAAMRPMIDHVVGGSWALVRPDETRECTRIEEVP